MYGMTRGLLVQRLRRHIEPAGPTDGRRLGIDGTITSLPKRFAYLVRPIYGLTIRRACEMIAS
jgi:hypothetical protein